jgi:hypothetical protein
MKKFLIAICAVMSLGGAVSVHASPNEYKYIFVPTSSDTSFYPLSDWGGALFLDAPMSLGGSLLDIGSNSVVKTPYGTFKLDDSSDEAIGTVTVDNAKVPVPFTWDSTTITSMKITGLGPLNVHGSEDSWEITQSSIEISLPDPMANGYWIASVPDSGSTVVLIGLAAAGLWGFSYRDRIRQQSMARR